MIVRLVLALALVCASCSSHEPSRPPAVTSSEDADLRGLRRLLAEDPAAPTLGPVDDAVDDDKPIRAAELLEVNAIPAARRALEDARAMGTRTPLGAEKKRMLVEAYEQRVAALVAYQRALSRGPIEDVQLLDAVHAYRLSEERLFAVHAALAPENASGSTTPPP